VQHALDRCPVKYRTSSIWLTGTSRHFVEDNMRWIITNRMSRFSTCIGIQRRNSYSHNRLSFHWTQKRIQTMYVLENQQDHGCTLHPRSTLNTIFVAMCHTSLFNYISFVIITDNSFPFDKLFKTLSMTISKRLTPWKHQSFGKCK